MLKTLKRGFMKYLFLLLILASNIALASTKVVAEGASAAVLYNNLNGSAVSIKETGVKKLILKDEIDEKDYIHTETLTCSLDMCSIESLSWDYLGG